MEQGQSDVVTGILGADRHKALVDHLRDEGTIDVALVRAQITAVMEGGEKVLRLRKEKYGF